MRFLIGIFAFLLSTSLASAAIVAQKSAKSELDGWHPQTKTHVIVASKGLMFASVGYQQANFFSKLYPEDQILFITNLPTSEGYRFTKQTQLKKQGFQIVEENSSPMTSSSFISSVLKYTGNIKTLTIISHNGVDKGPWLEDGDRRLDFKNESLMSQLKPAFNKDSWVRIQGCNSGWNVARYLSQYWNVPVLGSFTSTSFYYLTQGGSYELYTSIEDQKKSPEAAAAKKDIWSLNGNRDGESSMNCPEGMCLTLIPEAAPYHLQIHKSPEAAWLPMTKPVCASSISDERCQMALAESLLSGVGSISRPMALDDEDTFKSIVYQSICGSYSNERAQKACVQNLDSAYSKRLVYFPYKHGKMLKCSGLRACEFQQISIDLRINKPNSSSNSIFEYIDDAIAGYHLLRRF